MALQRVPWAVNGEGVQHSATLARQNTFQLGGDQTGIVGPDSLVVAAGEVPGGFVTVGPGSGMITYAQGRRNSQDMAYVSAKDQGVGVRNDSLHEVSINPTTSAGGRVDALVVEIVDPEFEGTSGTVDYSDHEFVRFRVIQGVPSNLQHPHQLSNLPRPTMVLARIHIPASTATITDEMITDLRHMAQSRFHRVPLIANINPTGNYQDLLGPNDTSWKTIYTFTDVNVPTWATRCHIEMDAGMFHTVEGLSRVMFRVVGRGQYQGLPTMETSYISEAGPSVRFMMMSAGTQNIAWRTAGSTSQIELQARRWPNSPGPGRVILPGGGASDAIAKGSITYEEHPMFDGESGI